LHAGALSRWELLRHLPGMITGRLPTHHPAIRRGRCRHIHVIAGTPLTVHLDGEFFCVPEEHIQEVEIRVLPGALRACVAKG
jgi:diacylglycerol kinase family enzyme